MRRLRCLFVLVVAATVVLAGRELKPRALWMDGDYVVDYERVGPTTVRTTNVATSLHEVRDPGAPGERREPGDQASGYLWRFRMYCAFDERPEGSVEQCESISLARAIPFAVSWLIKPFVTGIPRDTIAFTLGKVREGLVR